MFRVVSLIIDYFAPLFLVLSPVTSYADQILSIHRSKTSDGFSLDIPLIMLVASILKLFYWFGAYYSTSLLFQAVLMILVQSILLKVSLDNRPPTSMKEGLENAPFSAYNNRSIMQQTLSGQRPYQFWQWSSARRYYQFLLYLTATLLTIHVLVLPISSSTTYVNFLGYAGLAIEATLPLPQMLKNYRARSCKGFRLSVIVNWLIGDTLKMSYFFFSSEVIPLAFKLCGIFQFVCDLYLGLQFYMYGDGSRAGGIPEIEMPVAEKTVRIR